jgi:hypothetical protein
MKASSSSPQPMMAASTATAPMPSGLQRLGNESLRDGQSTAR